MIRDAIFVKIAETSGVAINGLLPNADLPLDAEAAAAVEIVLRYSPEVVCVDGKWKLVQQGRSAGILAEIENFSVSTGRKLFRVSSALKNIEVHEQPDEDELRQALGLSHGKYDLLPNAMIRRNY